MKPPALTGVTPSFRNSVPPATAVTLKCVTSAPSAALRETTSPAVVCASSAVAASLIVGASATAATLTVIASVSDRAPPVPLLPWSSVVTATVAAP